MRIVFMGSAPLAGISLESLLAAGRDEVAGVVCQPDRPRGRSLKVSACAVKTRAEAAGVPVLTFEKVNDAASISALRDLQPDLIVVVAYGQLLSRAILDLPPRGCVNLHASLLPKYRGAAPIQWAIARGETVTGVTSMYMTERMDAGDMILRREVPIGPDDTGGSLHDRLAEAGAATLLDTLDAVRAGQVPRIPQEESQATYAPKLCKEDGRICWTWPAREMRDRVRGFHPWPGCFCLVPAEAHLAARGTLKVLAVRVENMQALGGAVPGQVIEAGGDGPLVLAADRCVRLTEVQPEGGRAMPGAAYLRGHPMQAGMILR